MQQDILFIILTLDSLVVLAAGYRDLKDFNIPLTLLLASLPTLVYLSVLIAVEALVFGLIILAFAFIFAVSYYLGLMGLGDIIVYPRYPLAILISLLLNNHLSAVALIVSFTVATLIYYNREIKPILCVPRFFGTQYVKREHYMKPNVIPPGVKAEISDEELDAVKEKILEMKKDVCLKARVGYPLVGLFAVSYAISVAILFFTLT